MQIKERRFAQRGPARWKKGYTLVEVLFAILIAAISASVLFVGFDNGFALLRTTREDLRATQILMEKTEAIRLMSWQDVTNIANGLSFTNTYYPPGASTNQGTIYYGTVSSINSPGNMQAAYQANYKNNIQLVTIDLHWTNYVGKTKVPHAREMQTLCAQFGMQGFLY
jgi:prepilin-type N-terminal cleavage/methylation domain-containing protein